MIFSRGGGGEGGISLNKGLSSYPVVLAHGLSPRTGRQIVV